MTVITKAIVEKKPNDKMEQPLVVDDIPTSNTADPEAQRPQGGHPGLTIKDQIFILRRPNLRPSSMTLYCVLFAAILGMGTGVIGGLYIYRHYARDQVHRLRTGWYSIPYEGSNRSPIDRDGIIAGAQAERFKTHALSSQQDNNDLDDKYFKERIEIDLDDERYEKIDVPDFRDSRQGRFIHDFNNNLTAIIDIDGRCCFVMALNRSRVLPPRSMYDLLNKMSDGYYNVNTTVVRETMRAMLPPIEDTSVVGAYIEKECEDMSIYRLEKVNYTGTVKRSASTDALYGQFVGRNIVEVHVDNFDQVISAK